MSANRRIHERLARSFPLEYGVLPWSRHWLLRPIYRTVPSAQRNPRGTPTVPEPEPWSLPYLAVARFLGELLLTNGTRCWQSLDRVEPAAGLDLSEGGVRMTTSYPLWLGASLHLRIPSQQLECFGYTVLGKVVRLGKADRHDVEAGIAFTAIHPADRQGLIRFLTTPLPQLAAMRDGIRSSARPTDG